MRRSIAPNTAVVSNRTDNSKHSCQPFLSKALTLLTRGQSTFHSIRYPAQTRIIYPASSTRLPSGAISAKIVFGKIPQTPPGSPRLVGRKVYNDPARGNRILIFTNDFHAWNCGTPSCQITPITALPMHRHSS